jgi:aryl-alcohol dehydrogenase-like predicted oxidoreductase
MPHWKGPGNTHFRRQGEWWLSSLGIGTYLGEPDVATDELYARAVSRALKLGVNVVDTAINYRFQRSERSVGLALRSLVEGGELEREEVVISTKGGFLTPDGEMPLEPMSYFQKQYVQPGILRPEELVGGMHCMTPGFLEDQLERSRRNLGLDSIDIYYLHNPETQLQVLSRAEFLDRIQAAFALLQKCVGARLPFAGGVGAGGAAGRWPRSPVQGRTTALQPGHA